MRLRVPKTLVFLLLTVFIGALSGCSGAANREEREDRDPQIRKARERRAAHDFDGAIDLYLRALDRKPDLARAHLELGLVYDQEKNDDLRALYHYQRYLEMRPDAEKRDLVQKLIQHARISFAASLPDRPAEAVREIEMLRREVKTLRALLAEQGGTAAVERVAATPARVPSAAPAAPVTARAPAAAPPAATPTPAPTAAPSASPTAPVAAVAATGASETYVVRAGDTLSRIATRVYNDASKWDVIYNANRKTMPTTGSLKIGQTLVIPRGTGT